MFQFIAEKLYISDKGKSKSFQNGNVSMQDEESWCENKIQTERMQVKHIIKKCE